MRSIVEVLNEKESQIEMLRGEIEALQAAARILADSDDPKPGPHKLEPVPVAAKKWP